MVSHYEMREFLRLHIDRDCGATMDAALAYIDAAEQTERELTTWHAEMKAALGPDWPPDVIDTVAIRRLREERDELKAKLASLTSDTECPRCEGASVLHEYDNEPYPDCNGTGYVTEAAAKAVAEALK